MQKISTVQLFTSTSLEIIQDSISNFVKKQQVEIINTSLSSCYDQKNKCIVHTVAIAYSTLKTEDTIQQTLKGKATA
jgi:hypothetical protein